MNPLHTFYQDEHMRNAVKEFFIQELSLMAVEKTFNGESVSGIKEARDCIETAFTSLMEMYEPKETRKPESSR